MIDSILLKLFEITGLVRFEGTHLQDNDEDEEDHVAKKYLKDLLNNQ